MLAKLCRFKLWTHWDVFGWFTAQTLSQWIVIQTCLMFSRLRPDMLVACVWYSLTSSGSGRGFQRPSMARMVRVRHMPHLWFVSFPRWNSPISKVGNALTGQLLHFLPVPPCLLFSTLPPTRYSFLILKTKFSSFSFPLLLFFACFHLFLPTALPSPQSSPPLDLGLGHNDEWLFWCLWSYIHKPNMAQHLYLQHNKTWSHCNGVIWSQMDGQWPS